MFSRPKRARIIGYGGTLQRGAMRRRRQARRLMNTALVRQVLRRPLPVFRTSGELKGVDVDTDLSAGNVLATTSTNAGIFTINLVSPGSGPNNRVGRKIRCFSVRIKGTATYQYAATATTGTMRSSSIRIALVWDKQPSGVLPVFSAIFGTTVIDGTEASEFLDPLRYDNTGRFRVLKDLVLTASPTGQNENGGTTDAMQITHVYDEFIDLKRSMNNETVYGGQTVPTAIADVSSGALYMIIRAQTNESTSQWTLDNSFARLRYRD